jgi:hypothetical protein
MSRDAVLAQNILDTANALIEFIPTIREDIERNHQANGQYLKSVMNWTMHATWQNRASGGRKQTFSCLTNSYHMIVSAVFQYLGCSLSFLLYKVQPLQRFAVSYSPRSETDPSGVGDCRRRHVPNRLCVATFPPNRKVVILIYDTLIEKSGGLFNNKEC